MRIVTQIAMASVLVLVGYGSSFGQANAGSKTVVKTIKVKKVKPPKQIKNKDIQKAQKKLALTTSEKAIQKANQKRIQDERNALRKNNKKAAADFKAMQKAYTKKLREDEKRARKAR